MKEALHIQTTIQTCINTNCRQQRPKEKKKKRIDVTTHSRAQIQGLLDRIVGITTQRGSHLFNDAI